MLSVILGLLASPLGRIGGMVAGAGLLFSVGFYKGDVHRGRIDAALEASAMEAWDRAQAGAAKAANDADTASLTAENADLKTRIAEAQDAVSKVRTTDCFNPADMTQLRRLWSAPNAKAR